MQEKLSDIKEKLTEAKERWQEIWSGEGKPWHIKIMLLVTKGILWIVGLLFMTFVVVFFMTGKGAVSTKKADDTLAYLTCEQAVENKLKAPSTADFAGYGNSQIRQSGETFVIDSYVDAQNSFGAKVRTNWSCSATYKSGDPYASSNWSINAVTR